MLLLILYCVCFCRLELRGVVVVVIVDPCCRFLEVVLAVEVVTGVVLAAAAVAVVNLVDDVER